MSDFLWWRDGVIYQIYPRSFADRNGDGVGDLAGIRAHLDYLNGGPDSLGVDAIWISPIYPSPLYDFGYDVSDYEDIDPVFGSLAEFDRLVAEAHQRGIRVVLDLVMNHTSHLHPWFIESRSRRDNPRRDWYLWRDATNNWESVFGGNAWEYDSATGQYYYHQFLKEQPDLNWRNPAVRERMWQMIRFWLDRGVDGFRLDVVHSFIKDDQFRDNPPTWRPDRPGFGLRGFDRQQHLYDLDRPELTDILRQIRGVLDTYPDRMAIGEVENQDMAVRYIGPDKLNLAFNFDFTSQPWLPRAFQQSILKYEASLTPEAWPCYVLSNHDRPRHASRFGGGPYSDARAKVAAALLLTQRGTPVLYYGEEIGMQNTPIPRAELQDPPGIRYWPYPAGRDPERTPMQWSAEPGAGFTTGRPWLRLNADYRQRNVAAQQADPNSVLNFYKQLLRLRRASPALRRGQFVRLLRRPVEVLAYLRQSPEQTMLVALNFFGWPMNVKLDERLPGTSWQLRLSSVPGQHRRVQGRHLTLAPFEACILEESVNVKRSRRPPMGET
jgi:alpha-glucosidase